MVEEVSEAGGRVRAGFTPVPGFAVSHATHLTTSGLFCTRQVSQSQVPGGRVNKVLRLAAGAFAGLLSNLEDDSLLGSQFHVPSEGLNLSPAEDEDSLADLNSGTGEPCTGDANPGPLRISRTLPAFKTLAGLKGPSKSSLLSLAVAFTATVAGACFPFEAESVVFIVGALNVNPVDGEKDGGLAAVALTMGVEKVKGTSGVVGTVGTCLHTAGSFGRRVDGLLLGLRVEVGGGEEKLNVGRGQLLKGSEMAGRSGASGTSSSAFLDEGRILLSLFILPPPVPVLLVAGVLDSGYDRPLVLGGGAEASALWGDLLTGVPLLLFSTALLTDPGVNDGRKDMERLLATDAAAGIISFCTGGRAGSTFFFFDWKQETSRSV